ncbi:hypothetical protein LAZ67_21001015 [Cordylochernes scorpioides]|uniref:Uncharacterized protein n=1 Tax=Cordylochernes scorpioides TaxID=51811 RepID=A0ABY6LPN0_9ARAC|nr:hypothetical protein LAZ67_21001015 [Cordylochernes scorpioides]
MERFLIREGASDKQNQNENKEDKKIVKSTGNKRKYVEDYLKYGFIPSVNDPSLPFCLICQKTLSNETMVPSKLLRHIETNHREQMNNPISYFENIRSSFQKQSKKFKKFMTTSDEAQTASYMIAQLIARKKKAHAEAEEIILPALKIVAGCMLTNDAMEKVTKIPLSSKTIARRIEDMSEDIELQIKQSFNDSSTKWAIQLDETTDISNKAQLLAFLRSQVRVKSIFQRFERFSGKIVQRSLSCAKNLLIARGIVVNKYRSAVIEFFRRHRTSRRIQDKFTKKDQCTQKILRR